MRFALVYNQMNEGENIRLQLLNNKVLKDACDNRQLCVLSFLPHLLDCQSTCRKEYLQILREVSEKFRKNLWG